ncbi:Uncharacterised protein [Edwardsiella tarda]|nr:Uncharacterised protein [Edwardsiella tarda]
MVLRRLSWMVGSGAWLMPWVLLLWQWLETGRYQAALSAQAYRSWQMTVLLADAAFAGLLSLLALLVGRSPWRAVRRKVCGQADVWSSLWCWPYRYCLPCSSPACSGYMVEWARWVGPRGALRRR